MRAVLLVALIMLFQGCCSRGYVPHYILTDSPETKEAMHKCQEEPESVPELKQPVTKSPK